MMHLRRAGLDQRLPRPYRKRQICHPVAVKVADLMPVHPKLDPTKPVLPRLDPGPSPNLTPDPPSDARHVTLLTCRHLVSRLTKSYHWPVRFQRGRLASRPYVALLIMRATGRSIACRQRWHPQITYRLMQNQQQRRDGEHGHRRRDEDGARGTGDV